MAFAKLRERHHRTEAQTTSLKAAAPPNEEMQNIIKNMIARRETHQGKTRKAMAKLTPPSMRDPVAYAAALQTLG